MEYFKDRLKIAISDYSVNAFAKKSGITEGTLRIYLSGDSLPGLDKLIAISNAAEVNIEWLATGEGRIKKDKSRFNSDSKSFILCHDVVLRYQDGLKEKMSNEEHGKLLLLLCIIVSDQKIEWQTEEKVKEILDAIIKINQFYKLY